MDEILSTLGKAGVWFAGASNLVAVGAAIDRDAVLAWSAVGVGFCGMIVPRAIEWYGKIMEARRAQRQRDIELGAKMFGRFEQQKEELEKEVSLNKTTIKGLNDRIDELTKTMAGYKACPYACREDATCQADDDPQH